MGKLTICDVRIETGEMPLLSQVGFELLKSGLSVASQTMGPLVLSEEPIEGDDNPLQEHGLGLLGEDVSLFYVSVNSQRKGVAQSLVIDGVFFQECVPLFTNMYPVCVSIGDEILSEFKARCQKPIEPQHCVLHLFDTRA